MGTWLRIGKEASKMGSIVRNVDKLTWKMNEISDFLSPHSELENQNVYKYVDWPIGNYKHLNCLIDASSSEIFIHRK